MLRQGVQRVLQRPSAVAAVPQAAAAGRLLSLRSLHRLSAVRAGCRLQPLQQSLALRQTQPIKAAAVSSTGLLQQQQQQQRWFSAEAEKPAAAAAGEEASQEDLLANFKFLNPKLGQAPPSFLGTPTQPRPAHESDKELENRRVEFDWHLEWDERFQNLVPTGPRRDIHPVHRGHYVPGARVAPKRLGYRLPLFDFVYAPRGAHKDLSLLGQSEAALARYFPISDSLFQWLPEGFRKVLSEEYMQTGGFMMQRAPAFQLVQRLKTLGAGPTAPSWAKAECRALQAELKKPRTQQPPAAAAEEDEDAEPQAAPSALPKNLRGRLVAVTGQSGCGKSVTLVQAAMAARQLGHLVIPSWGPDIWNDLKGFIRPSMRPESFERHPRGLYDQARFTSAWLTELIRTSGPELAQIRLHKLYPYWQAMGDEDVQKRRRYRRRVARAATNLVVDKENPEIAKDREFWELHCAEQRAARAQVQEVPPTHPEAHTLYDLVAWGALNEEEAPDVLFDVIEVLQHQKQVPVTVIIDNLNSWDTVSDFHEPETVKRLDRRQLAMVDAFWRLVEKPPRNGTVIVGLTGNETLKKAKLYLDMADDVIMMHPFSEKELSQAVVHYSASNLLQLEVTRRAIARVKAFTGAVPRDVFKYAWLM